jgi:hypothetical protein
MNPDGVVTFRVSNLLNTQKSHTQRLKEGNGSFFPFQREFQWSLVCSLEEVYVIGVDFIH